MLIDFRKKLSHQRPGQTEGCRMLRLPEFLDIWHIRLLALHTGLLYHSRRYSWYSVVLDAESTPGSEHSMAGRIKSMKNPSVPIGNGSCDLPACSTMPQPPVLLHSLIVDLVNGICMHNIVTRIGVKSGYIAV